MYGEHLKQEYIDTLVGDARNKARALFNATETQEGTLDLDLCDWNDAQVIDFLNNKDFIDLPSLRNLISHIRRYKQKMGGSECNIGAEKVDVSSIMRRILYPTPEALLKEISYGLPLDQGHPEVAALCLAWIGIKTKDVDSLRPDQIDLRNGTSLYMHANNQIDPVILSVLRTYKSTFKAERIQSFPYDVFYQETGYFLHRMLPSGSQKTGSKIPLTNIQSAITELRIKVSDNPARNGDSYLSYLTVLKSGRFRRLYESEVAWINTGADNVREHLNAALDNKASYKDNMYIYEQYKKAFNLN